MYSPRIRAFEESLIAIQLPLRSSTIGSIQEARSLALSKRNEGGETRGISICDSRRNAVTTSAMRRARIYERSPGTVPGSRVSIYPRRPRVAFHGAQSSMYG